MFHARGFMILVITFMAMIYQYYDVVIVNRVW